MGHILQPGTPYDRELAVAIEAARGASAAILPFYEQRTAETYTKGDGSPVTDADLASDAFIQQTIHAAFPDDAILTEEGAKDLARVDNPRCWIADPLDGTAQFVAGTDRFEVLIALIENGRPVVAVSAHPPSGLIHAAVAGAGAWTILGDEVKPFSITPSQEPPRIVSSKWYRGREGRDQILAAAARLGASEPPIMEIGFQPRAFDDVVRTYDVFLGLWPDNQASIAQEWDVAASDLIVNEAGGRLTDFWGRPHQYNKRDTGVVGGLLAVADPETHRRVLDAFAPIRPDDAPALAGVDPEA
ncbi:MAG TPA: 3'(2'),5'-bisphosphate nucleotidase CysQ [Thermomicrobiales bacterium]|nr:3'(2'),5'-bisphosphate nucleotidase CysQ [Thermomicrobiales bacterium]